MSARDVLTEGRWRIENGERIRSQIKVLQQDACVKNFIDQDTKQMNIDLIYTK